MRLLVAGVAVFAAWHAGQTDGNAGKQVFAKRCSGCHALDTDQGGPRLRGVFNRKAGAVRGFLYSNALRRSGILWDERSLDEWLRNPEAMVKDSDMEVSVADADERKLIIAYLKSAAK